MTTEISRQRRWQLRNPDKFRAQQIARYAIQSGKLLRQPCEKCGGKAQSHHNDYSKPLEVTWLCPQHHREVHGRARKGKKNHRRAPSQTQMTISIPKWLVAEIDEEARTDGVSRSKWLRTNLDCIVKKSLPT